MTGLDRKFRHKALYKGSALTMREFLELAAECGDFYISEETQFEGDNLLDDNIKKYNILKCDGTKYQVKLNDEEVNYFNNRRNFWKQWHSDFAQNKFNGIYNVTYIELEKAEKMKIPEYKQAKLKIQSKK